MMKIGDPITGPRKATRITTSSMYNNIPDPLPPSLPSLNFEATDAAEFGNQVQFGDGSSRQLGWVRIGMASWAYYSKYAVFVGDMNTGGFHWPITLSLYEVNGDNSPGAVLGSVEQECFIPWRPEPDAVKCPGTTRWFSNVSGLCHNGMAFDLTFDFRDVPLTVPDRIIFGIGYHTQSGGQPPTGEIGPYNDLNVGVSSSNALGSNPMSPQCYLNSSAGDSYADGGAGGLNTFRLDVGGNYPDIAIEFNSSDGEAIPMSVLFHSYRQRRE